MSGPHPADAGSLLSADWGLDQDDFGQNYCFPFSCWTVYLGVIRPGLLFYCAYIYWYKDNIHTETSSQVVSGATRSSNIGATRDSRLLYVTVTVTVTWNNVG